MTSTLKNIVAEAKKGRFSAMKDTLSEDDVSQVWENISSFIEKTMSQTKGVLIPGFGTFTFTQQRLDVGNGKHLLIQRPVFVPLEKFVQHHGLKSFKHFVPGHIPTMQLNYAALAQESPFDRDTVETCVREVIHAVAKAVNAKKNVELTFSGVGRLMIRDSKIKMKFYKMFVNQMDATGKVIDSMQNRPGTADSVMSDRLSVRPRTSGTVILPRLGNQNGSCQLEPVEEVEFEENNISSNALPAEPQTESYLPEDIENVDQVVMEPDLSDEAAEPHIVETLEAPTIPITSTEAMLARDALSPPFGDLATEMAYQHVMNTGQDDTGPGISDFEQGGGDETRKSFPPSRMGTRMAMPLPKATGFSLTEGGMPGLQGPPGGASPKPLSRAASGRPQGVQSPAQGLGNKPPTPPRLAPLQRPRSAEDLRPPELPPPQSSCGHRAGQELCYLCHQRDRRNVPVSFTEERRRREEEEERLLNQYRTMKDAEQMLKEQERNMNKRQELQKSQAFNLGVAEAINEKKRARDTDFHRSYIFHRRPLTPPRIHKQVEYAKDLTKQVEVKEATAKKVKNDEDFMERLEQVQLAEDLAAQREQYLRNKAEQREMYKNALDTQVKYKPGQLPPREPDYEVFGKNDTTNEKMQERRQRAYELFREQQDLVAQRKREALLKRLSEQREEEAMLERNKKELLEDRAFRFKTRMDARRRLEDDWLSAAQGKHEAESEERKRAATPGELLHEQCDRYRRCAQCQRRITNCGETNIWKESHFVPGSRLMV